MTAAETPVPAVGPAAQPAAHAAAASHDEGGRVRIYVWQVPVRLTHWVTAAAIVVFRETGSTTAVSVLLGLAAVPVVLLGTFAVLAALGKTDLFRTHEVPRIKAVLETLRVI